MPPADPPVTVRVYGDGRKRLADTALASVALALHDAIAWMAHAPAQIIAVTVPGGYVARFKRDASGAWGPSVAGAMRAPVQPAADDRPYDTHAVSVREARRELRADGGHLSHAQRRDLLMLAAERDSCGGPVSVRATRTNGGARRSLVRAGLIAVTADAMHVDLTDDGRAVAAVLQRKGTGT